MANIQILPVHLVNKIAAGEVIERPASIVKELVENALDAHASRIDVAIEDGGKRLIAVSDNGVGMGREDLGLAFVPHATSKLRDEDGLFAIGTMGFRGEALPSIASVSHAHIRTRRREEDADGYEIDAAGETIGEPRPCAAAGGTTVTIRDLFFNTPARRKFLKSATTEMGHITEQVIRLALPYPQVAFTLSHNGRRVQNFPAAASTRQRASDIFGPELAEGLLTVAARSTPVSSVAGLVGKPDAARSTAAWQYVFLNGRFIRDRLLSHAVKEAYRGLIEPSRWPVAFLFLTVDPAEVDVNVHPAKIEVRFRDGQAIHGQLLAALRETLNRSNLAPTATFADPRPGGGFHPNHQHPPVAEEPAGGEGDGQANASDDASRKQSLRQALVDFFKSVPTPQPALQFGEDARPRWEPRHDDAGTRRRGDAETAEPHGAGVSPASGEAGLTFSSDQANGTHNAGETPAPRALPASSLFQLHNTYIVAADGDGLVIVDQHALHERILYNDLLRRIADGPLMSQRLLIPQTLRVSPAQQSAAEENGSLLASLGLEVEPFGPNTLAIHRLPVLLADGDASTFVRELLDRLLNSAPTESEHPLEPLLEMMACKAAVKAGDPLTVPEMDALLARRSDCEKSSACPHGRPTTLRLTVAELEKQFKRT